MRLYIQLFFDSNGENPLDILDEMKDLGFDPVVGDYDFAKDYESPDEYKDIVGDLIEALEDTGVRYRLTTRKK